MTQVSNAISTSNEGGFFEARVKAIYVILMLKGGHVPGMPPWPIKEIRQQTRADGWSTDDLAVVVEDPGGERRQLVAQIKRSIQIAQGDEAFKNFIHGAWRDFTNTKLFTKEADAIALITGSLSKTDVENVPWLCDQARATVDAEQFLNNIGSSSKLKKGKLDVIKRHLEEANGGKISNDDLHSFFRHFQLLVYDLTTGSSVIAPLLTSYIAQSSREDPRLLWSKLVEFVQDNNRQATPITLDTIPSWLKEKFSGSANRQASVWSNYPHPIPILLAKANFVGSWNESSGFRDTDVLVELMEVQRDTWEEQAPRILNLTNSPLSRNNGQWHIAERLKLWQAVGNNLFEKQLINFLNIAVGILREHTSHGLYSRELRKGISEGLALLGSTPSVLTNCSPSYVRGTIDIAIQEILKDSDWKLWISLNEFLPALAEAAPNKFLKSVNNMLRKNPNMYKRFPEQLSGLLQALEGLAWDENYLFEVCEILIQFDKVDSSSGDGAAQPFNSLVAILLPWCPQTTAPAKVRMSVFDGLSIEHPHVAWKVLVKLLPEQTKVGSYTYKPNWRTGALKGWEEGVTIGEYRQQVTHYAKLAVSSAKDDGKKIIQLVNMLNHLPIEYGLNLIQYLSSDMAQKALSKNFRVRIWERLANLLRRQQNHPDPDWMSEGELFDKVEEVANKLKPKSPLDLHRWLFNNDVWHALRTKHKGGAWEQQLEDLAKRRERAIQEILNHGNIEDVFRFARSVEFPCEVGVALGKVANTKVDSRVLECLKSDNNSLVALASCFVVARHHFGNREWDVSSLNVEQKALFLSLLPFEKVTWQLAKSYLGERQGAYWKRVIPKPSHDPSNLGIAVDKLIEYGRPRAAIDCLYEMAHKKENFNVKQCVGALKAAANSKENATPSDKFLTTELIKYLQRHPKVSQRDLAHIEWMYLPLLDGHQENSPKFLERHLAEDPNFFCQVIGSIYRSTREDMPQPAMTAELRAAGSNSWRLLSWWKIIPGTQADGSFSDEQFLSWLKRVKEVCAETGRLESALTHVGQVLSYAPQDDRGILKSKAIAEALNEADAERMRGGWIMGPSIPHIAVVDPTGEPEKEKAKDHRGKAMANREVGYHRIARSLEDRADDYERRAEQISTKYQENP